MSNHFKTPETQSETSPQQSSTDYFLQSVEQDPIEALRLIRGHEQEIIQNLQQKIDPDNRNTEGLFHKRLALALLLQYGPLSLQDHPGAKAHYEKILRDSAVGATSKVKVRFYLATLVQDVRSPLRDFLLAKVLYENICRDPAASSKTKVKARFNLAILVQNAPPPLRDLPLEKTLYENILRDSAADATTKAKARGQLAMLMQKISSMSQNNPNTEGEHRLPQKRKRS